MISRPRAESIASFDRLKKLVGFSRYCSASLNRSPSRTRSRCIVAPRKGEAMPIDDLQKWPFRASPEPVPAHSRSVLRRVCEKGAPSRCRNAQMANAERGYRLIFNTHAGCPRKSSGRSGSCTESPVFEALNFNGALAPSKATDFAAVRSLMTRPCPDHRGRIA
jgi:hypothetical protein